MLLEPLSRRCATKRADDLVLTSPEVSVLRSGNFWRRNFDPVATEAPLIPAMLSVRTYDQLIDFVDTMPGRKPQVVGFLSMVDRRKKSHREFAERLPNDHASVVHEAIPSRVVLEQMAAERAPVPAFAPASSATAAYEALWARVQSCLNDTG